MSSLFLFILAVTAICIGYFNSRTVRTAKLIASLAHISRKVILVECMNKPLTYISLIFTILYLLIIGYFVYISEYTYLQILIFIHLFTAYGIPVNYLRVLQIFRSRLFKTVIEHRKTSSKKHPDKLMKALYTLNKILRDRDLRKKISLITRYGRY